MLRNSRSVHAPVERREPNSRAAQRQRTAKTKQAKIDNYILSRNAGAAIELDGKRVPVGTASAVMTPPGVRHRSVGRMTILNVVVPTFDPADEWFD